MSIQRISEASDFVDSVNIPEVTNLSVVFNYNYFLKDERVSSRPLQAEDTRDVKQVPINKIARYCTLSWTVPNSTNTGYQTGRNLLVTEDQLRRAAALGQIVSEDNFFDPGYLNHTFSNVSSIEQGSSDLENYSRLSNDDAESMFKMANYHVQRVGLGQTAQNQYNLMTNSLESAAAAYPKLSNTPQKALGLRVYDREGNLSDKDDLIRSVTESLSLRLKINRAIIPDIFKDPVDLCPFDIQRLSVKYEDNVKGLSYQQNPLIPVVIDDPGDDDLGNQATVIGYIIDSYIYSGGDFKKQGTYYLPGKNSNVFIDRNVKYGKKYYYTVRTVASIKLYLYEEGSPSVKRAEVYVSSRCASSSVDTYEYVPPPEPQLLKFNFDYVKRNLIISWSSPINHQKDIKQYQVFRRASIKHPFELIAQYGFDDSLPEAGGEKYKTSEEVDANNYQSMRPELKFLVKQREGNLIDRHVDEDFTVDPELYESSDYIYAVCSVDAHRMISNYSTQYRVTFDSRKNRLVTSVICDSGCPRQYPNIKLNVDTFKDSIKVSGDVSKKLNIYFTPEYLKLKSEKGTTFKVLEAKTPSQSFSPYYLFQMINLDNQKMQSIRINVNDPEGLTLT